MRDKVDIRQLDEFTKMIDYLIDHYEEVLSLDIEGIAKTKTEILEAKNAVDTIKQQVEQMVRVSAELNKVKQMVELLEELKDGEKRINELLKNIKAPNVETSATINDTAPSPNTTYSSSKIGELLGQLKQSIQELLPKNTITTNDEGKIDKSVIPELNKSDIGLSNVDDTADINKPISTATRQALDTKLGKDEIASDSTKLGGKLASQYITKQELKTELKTDTYKGVRIFSRLSSVPYQWFYQEVTRDASTNEIIKYGDIFCKGAVAYSAQTPYAVSYDRYADFMRVSLPYNEECVELVSSTGQYSNAFVIAKLKAKPYIYVWGYNGYGQLGAGHTNNITIPKKVEFNANVKEVWSYMAQTTACECTVWVLLENDELYVCGHNGNAELGIGTTVNSSKFIKSSLSGKGIVRVFVSAGLTSFVVTRAKSGLRDRYDVWGCGYNQFGSLGVSGTNKTSWVEVVKDVQSFEADEYGNYPSSSGNSYHDCAWYIKDGKAYAAGLVDGMVKFGVGSNQRNRPYEAIKRTDGTEFEGVKWVHIFNYRLGMLLTNDGKLFLNNNEDISATLVGLNGEVLRNKGWQLYANNVKEVKILSQRYYYYYNALLILNDGSCYHISNSSNIRSYGGANLTVSNPSLTDKTNAYSAQNNTLVKISDAKLDMPIPYSNKLEFGAYPISDSSDLELQSIFICDGKKIYSNGTANASYTTLINSNSLSPLNLANTGER
ncbi:hypothetical protein U5B43_02880 [Campylobacter sp. 9BO]|uniref:hypothetical protein n=1 Tax=Campylobacter sp. 9BO TaxID=3424759 RepID=UPI003D34180F